MRQVPIKSEFPYLLIGNGRLAKHFAEYFTLNQIPFLTWSRSSKKSLSKLISKSKKILVLINDDAIEKFIRHNNKGFENKIWIHCSGLLSFPFAESAHPLMTFTNKLYDLKTYNQIPFITEKGKRNFKELFPELNNPSFRIDKELKPYYHAWCVMSGNFSTIIWQRFFNVLEDKFGISRKYAFPYLTNIEKNLRTIEVPLTGPLIRNDKQVIRENLRALKDDPFVKIYKAFIETYNMINQDR